MSDSNFTVSVRVAATPDQAFAAIVDPRSWWGENIEGDAGRVGAEWSYRYKDLHYSQQKTTELVLGRRVVWEVIDSALNFIEDRTEWTGTTIRFDIAPKGEQTEIVFTHVGIRPAVECYAICSDAWTGLITGSLRELIETGAGDPDSVEKTAA